MSNQSLHAFAKLLILATQKNVNLQGKPPTEEELSALLNGRLDKTRTMQIYGYLNADAKLFAQWIGLVEAVTLVESNNNDIGNVTVKKSASTFSFYGFFDVLLTNKWLAIPSGVFACSIVIWITINSNYFSPTQTSSLSFSANDLTTFNDEKLIEALTSSLTAVKEDCSNVMQSATNQGMYKRVMETYSIEVTKREMNISNMLTLHRIRSLNDAKSICQFNQALLKRIPK